MKSNRIFYIFLLALFILLIFPNLLQKGIFVDGLWYATISRNMAEGFGSFWSPAFTRTMFTEFYEHPPLVFWIQSQFFKVLGDALYVEKVYSLIISILTLLLIFKLWRTLFRDRAELKDLAYIPGILWILFETVYLFYPNNMLESSMGVFTLSSVILIIRGLQLKNSFTYLFLVLAGLCLISAFLCKGFTGLYPLSAILIYALIYRDIQWKQLLLYNGVLWGVFSLIFFMFLFNDSAANHLDNYLDTQVLAAIIGERTENMHNTRFYIVRRLLETSLLPIALVTCLSLIAYYRQGVRQFFQHKKEICFFLLLCLSGVLPMMISKKQGTYYILTVYPYFAIVLSLILVQSKTLLAQLSHSKAFRLFTYSFLAASLLIASLNINKVNKRDRILLQDVELLAAEIAPNSSLGSINKKSEQCLYGFFMRMYSISLDTQNPKDYPLILCDKDIKMDSEIYTAIDLETEKFSLYKKSAPGSD